MIRMTLDNCKKEVGFGLEFQVNEVNLWNEELQLWEKIYSLAAYWEVKKRFKKVEYRVVSLFESTNKEVVIELFNLFQKEQDLLKGVQVFKKFIE